MADTSTATMVDWSKFNSIFGGKDNMFSLPRRWSGRDYYADLNKLLKDFEEKVGSEYNEDETFTGKLRGIKENVLSLVREYLHGYPAKAYSIIEELMRELETEPLYADPTTLGNLYRMTEVSENVVYDRDRIFHAPYNMISKLKTYRYSIAGYPSLYLASSLKLAESESSIFETRKPAIAARFELEPGFYDEIKILEFGCRPQDLAGSEENLSKREDFRKAIRAADKRQKNEAYEKLPPPDSSGSSHTPTTNAPKRYMLWYPLIAACSYIRANRDDPFAQEYMVPQLVTQWLRSQNTGKLVGIKYFSCYSIKSSELGANYVFPTSGDPILLPPEMGETTARVENHCPILNDAFLLTAPEYVPEYASADELVEVLDEKKENEFKHAFNFSWEKFTGGVKIPEQVMYIASRTFDGCVELTSVDLSGSVVGIGEDAFWGCEKLNRVLGTDGLESIGGGAFKGCSSLTEIELPDGLESIGDWAFDGCSSLTGIKLPDGLKSIGDLAFYGCSSLKQIKLPNRLESIGDFAFSDCSSLKEIKLPDGLESIGDRAFNYCSNLQKIEFPNGLESIGDGAFYGCSSLTEIKLPDGLKSIGKWAFYDCSNLKEIKLPDGLKSIGNGAFSGCSSLQKIDLPDGLKSIGDGAFSGCSSLKEIKLPKGLENIGTRAFFGCSNLKEIKLPDGLKSIGKWAFKGCSSLTGIKLPDGLKSLGAWAFGGCSSLQKIELPDGLKSIGDWAFYGCSSLQKTEFPNGLESIGDWAFGGCSSLQKIELPEGLESIGDMAFKGCSSLTEIKLPKGLESIGDRAFKGCSSLDIINFNGNLEQWLKIRKDFEWDDGTPEFTVHFSDGTYMEKAELYELERQKQPSTT